MEEFLDNLWLKIVMIFHYIEGVLDFVFAPLNIMGPAFAISFIAFVTVLIAKTLTRLIKTKRYEELKKEFLHWHSIREEAVKSADGRKGKLLAKNIDRAKLNKAYYDYFFEGLMLGLVTKVLPILLMMAYVNETYKPEKLLKHFGRDYIFKFSNPGGEAIVIGGVFWFILSVVFIYLSWFLIKQIYLSWFKKA